MFLSAAAVTSCRRVRGSQETPEGFYEDWREGSRRGRQQHGFNVVGEIRSRCQELRRDLNPGACESGPIFDKRGDGHKAVVTSLQSAERRIEDRHKSVSDNDVVWRDARIVR